MHRLLQANELYKKIPKEFLDRNDAIAMQYLIEDWQFDSKRPTLIR